MVLPEILLINTKLRFSDIFSIWKNKILWHSLINCLHRKSVIIMYLYFLALGCTPSLEKAPTDYFFLLIKAKTYKINFKIIELEGSGFNLEINSTDKTNNQLVETLSPLANEKTVTSNLSYSSETIIHTIIKSQPISPAEVCSINKLQSQILDSDLIDFKINSSIGSVLKIWVTNATTNGNLNGTGGTLGGDAICNNAGDANHPGSGTYKALIWTGTRTSISADWPLLSLTNYYRTDGTTLIGATNNQKIFSATLNNPIHTTNFKVWTGIRANSNPWAMAPVDHCLNFTSNSMANNSVFGSSDQTAPGDAFGRPGVPNSDSCDQNNHLYCVEQ